MSCKIRNSIIFGDKYFFSCSTSSNIAEKERELLLKCIWKDGKRKKKVSYMFIKISVSSVIGDVKV